MRFAIFNKERVEATSGLKGAICPLCSQAVIAKCGTQKVNHWAHRTIKTCDSWWEPETEWHRSWKNNFPADWQEVILFDEITNEKHIADIRTKHGLIIEFQYSHINPEESNSRENFYKNMIWVVDGTRLKRDYPRFIEGFNSIRPTRKKGIYFIDFANECFPTKWLNNSVPVIFDFHDNVSSIELNNVYRKYLWCLLPNVKGERRLLIAFDPKDFIGLCFKQSKLIL